MVALANKTKIKNLTGSIPSTATSIKYKLQAVPSTWISNPPIDLNSNSIASGSIQIQAQQFMPELSQKAKEISYKLFKFGELADNWDGNAAIRPNRQEIIKAHNFLSQADAFDLPVFFTAPGPNGEIILEYLSGVKSAEVYFEKDEFSEMILYEGNSQVYNGEILLSNLINHFKNS